MSIKSQIFHAVMPAPATPCEFVVTIPGILDSPLRCVAASLPFDIRKENVIKVGGQEVHIPGKSHVVREWTCRLVESVLYDIVYQIELLQAVKLDYYPVFVQMLSNSIPVYGRVLHDAWLVSIDPVSLDSSDVSKAVAYDLKFRYQYTTRIL